MANGNFSNYVQGSNTSNYFGLYCEYSFAQNVTGNYTDVTVSAWIRYYSIEVAARSGGVVNVGGTTKSFSTSAITNYPSGGGGVTKLTQQTIRVVHNSDGTKKNVSISVSWPVQITYAGTYYGTLTASTTVDLPTIPRASGIGNIDGNTIGSAITININRYSDSFTHYVYYSFGDTKNYCLSTNATTSCTFTPSMNDCSYIPNSTNGTATITVDTYNGSTKIGTASKSFALYVPNTAVPTVGTITLDPADVNGKNILVQGKNKLTVSVSGCAAGIGSTIKSYTFSGPGVSYTGTNSSVTSSGTISNTGTLTYTVTVTDGRGRTASKNATIQCYGYALPYFTSFSAFRSNASGTNDGNGTYAKCSYGLAYSSVNNTNNLTVTIYYKKSSAQTYSSVVASSNGTTTSGNKILSSIALDSAYDVYATVADAYGGTTQSTRETVFGESRVFNITSDGTGVAIGKMAEDTQLFDSRWPIHTDAPEKTMKNLTYKGANVISSTNDTTTNWGNQGNLATVFYSSTGQIADQPSQYGFVLNLTNGPNSTEVHQLWATQSSGSLAHRGGNSNGWNGSWKTVLDSTNYTNYVVTPVDYIVEEKVNNDFKYRKWNSGLSELWYYKYHGEIEMTTAMADNVYSNSSCSGVQVTLPSGVFLADSIPMAQGNVYSNGYTCCQVCDASSTKFSYRIWSPYSTKITGCRLSVYMTGVWK